MGAVKQRNLLALHAEIIANMRSNGEGRMALTTSARDRFQVDQGVNSYAIFTLVTLSRTLARIGNRSDW